MVLGFSPYLPPDLWNQLPDDIRFSDNLTMFRSKLKNIYIFLISLSRISFYLIFIFHFCFFYNPMNIVYSA